MHLNVSEPDGAEGVLYVAFGRQYALSAAASAAATAAQTQLPVHVLTNVRRKVLNKMSWPEGTTFTHFDRPDEDNREIRTRMIEFTPFDRTLHLDADAVIVSGQAAVPLRYLAAFDAVFVGYRSISGCALADQWGPIKNDLADANHFAICGGLMWFARNERTEEMFRLWNGYWREEGRGRDMPGLFRAIWNSHIRMWMLPGEHLWIGTTTGYVHHSPGRNVPELPQIVKLKPNALGPDGRKRRWVQVDQRGRPIEPAAKGGKKAK